MEASRLTCMYMSVQTYCAGLDMYFGSVCMYVCMKGYSMHRAISCHTFSKVVTLLIKQTTSWDCQPLASVTTDLSRVNGPHR